ncbi:MAG: bifunctional DNA-formamidopyrimidine glycosylase/DNA-(apurinic or apyrimidinic site) lyase [Succinivibrionaceae bacterium]
MPELPEVEVVRKELEKVLIDNIILKFTVRNTTLRETISSQLYTLRNLKVLKIDRRGKYLIIKTDKGSILIHLGMSGKLFIINNNFDNLSKHDHIDIVLSNNIIIRYNDVRKFGLVLWVDKDIDVYSTKWLNKLGYEPFDQTLTPEIFYQEITKKKTNVKKVLMDGFIVVGIGNIYASEVLFLSSIHPNKLASDLSFRECSILLSHIRETLQKSIEKGGTTIKDYKDSHGNKGGFADYLKIYGKENSPCCICGTPIKNIKINGRSTYFCPLCQKL